MKKVMLAANDKIDINNLTYPVLASGKIDGVRACVQEGKLVAGRSLKDSLNRHITECLSDPVYEGLDGELTLQGEYWNNFNKNQSAIMEQSGKPKLIYWVFEYLDDDMDASHRKSIACQHVEGIKDLDVRFEMRFCTQHLVNSPAELDELYAYYRSLGYEGLIVMKPSGKYKHGRSTLKQELMLKMKPHDDSEATLIGMNELMRNLDAGNSKRQENMVPANTMGNLVVSWQGKTFEIGTGFSDAQRKDFWINFDKYEGKLVKFKYMQLSDYGIPRHTVYLGMRSKDDM